MALASCLRRTAAAGMLRPTVLMSSPAALARSTFDTRLNQEYMCSAPSVTGSSLFRRSHARDSYCTALAPWQVRRPDGIQGSSPGGSERDCATDVDAGAEKDPEYHTTDLRTASARGYVKRVRLLLDQGAEVNKYWHEDYQSGTALHFSVREANSVELVKLLLARGADVGVRDEIGWTPLLIAVGQGTMSRRTGDREHYALPCTELLIKAGADINAQDKEGKTPLHWASTWGRVEVVQLLLERGAVVDARDEEGRTPLHEAADWPSANADKVVELLAAAGANINARDKKRNTALHIAAEWNCNALRQLVKQPGVQLDARNGGGLTPVAVAVKGNNLGAVKVLRAAGADMVNPKLHRVPLLVRAEKALNVVINKDEEAIRYDEKAYYLQAQGFYRIVKYLKAACVTAVPPSTPAKPRLGRPPRSAGGPAAGGSDSEE